MTFLQVPSLKKKLHSATVEKAPWGATCTSSPFLQVDGLLITATALCSEREILTLLHGGIGKYTVGSEVRKGSFCKPSPGGELF